MEHKGPNYTFFYNDGTKLGELHVGGYKIPMAEGDATAFYEAAEQTRQTLLPQYVRAQEARKRKP